MHLLANCQLSAYICKMIQSFRHKGLKRFFEKGDSSKLQQTHVEKLRLILKLLGDAANIKDMDFPGSNLHSLKGDLADFWSVTVNKNWRIVFRFEDGDALDVDYIDYH